ncbi:MAG: radical SAM protein [Deltaproteobacteria bacterium]|nr:radical SAM protein [Deltaproteobacteria bacterium]
MSRKISHADIKLNYLCNNCCIHCNVSDVRERIEKGGRGFQPSTAEIVRKITGFRNEGVEAITLTGGEPTLRNDLVKIVRHATGLGMFIGIQTNARALSYLKRAQIFARFGAHFVVSVHGSRRDIHDSITGVAGSFQQTEQGLFNLLSLGCSVSANCVVSRRNMGDLVETAGHFHSMGVNRINFVFPQITGNALLFFDDVVPGFPELKEEIAALIDFADGRHGALIMKFHNFPLCTINGRVDLSPDGDLKNVESRLKNLNLEERNWGDDKRNELKTKFVKCGACAHSGTCEGVWKEYASKFGEEAFIPFSS